MNTFNFNGTTLRTIEIDGAPWFHGADSCRCLGLSINVSGVFNNLRCLGHDEKRPTPTPFRGTGGAKATVISESGLYKLIMRSDKPEARAFQDWVTREVLPAIRRTGGYLLNEEARQTAHAGMRCHCQRPVRQPGGPVHTGSSNHSLFDPLRFPLFGPFNRHK